MLTGGAPFTKDAVYLDGLTRVHNFLKCAAEVGRSDCLGMLFCGKVDLDDIPAICELSNSGLCLPPKFVPPWASDLRFLLSYLAYASFLQGVDLQANDRHCKLLLAAAPRVQPPDAC